jgi:dsDNA-binding SOS-regulon protein
MANVTLSMGDEQLTRLRVYAAQNRTTVNAIFRKHADDLLDGDERRKKAREWMVSKIKENIARDEERAAARARGEDIDEETWRWNREDCYTGSRFDRMQGR